MTNNDFQKKKKKHASPHFKKKQGTLSDSFSDTFDENQFKQTDNHFKNRGDIHSPKSALSANAPAIASQNKLQIGKSDSKKDDKEENDKKEMEAEEVNNQIDSSTKQNQGDKLDVDVVDCCFKNCYCARG